MVAVAIASAANVQPVQRIWPHSTVVCLGSGPSVTQADIDACRGRARVIAIKSTYRLAPWADALYSGDELWWCAYGPTLDFAGLRFACTDLGSANIAAVEAAGAHRLRMGDVTRLESDRCKLATGHHSGFQAINLAVHLGARRIVLLGYDMKAAPDGRTNVFPESAYKKKPPPFQWVGAFEAMPAALSRLGVRVLNATRETALTVFPRVTLEEALA